mgnify:CR=1 FL=1
MKIGIVFGSFDLLHAGHIHLLEQCKKYCDALVVGLHVDPSIERSDKNSPIETIVERQAKLRACKHVNDIIVYQTEADLKLILQSGEFDIRFLGTDTKDGRKITAEDVVPIEYIESLPIHTSDIRKRIKIKCECHYQCGCDKGECNCYSPSG